MGEQILWREGRILWKDDTMSIHCPEYEGLTIENKLLVDEEMKEWFIKFNSQCIPTFIFREAERRIIEKLKRKETNDGRNRESGTGRTNHK